MDALLSKKFLESINVMLDEPTYKALSEHYETTLSDRVMTEIIDELDEVHLQELSRLKGGDSTVLQGWLLRNVPQLNEIIEDEIAILLGEIAENSEQL